MEPTEKIYYGQVKIPETNDYQIVANILTTGLNGYPIFTPNRTDRPISELDYRAIYYYSSLEQVNLQLPNIRIRNNQTNDSYVIRLADFVQVAPEVLKYLSLTGSTGFAPVIPCIP